MLKIYIIGVLLVTALLVLGACTPAPAPEPALITKDASELVLTLKDFSAGWILIRETVTDEGYYEREFLEEGVFMPEQVVCRVKVFSAITEAEEEYSAILAGISETYSTDELKVGDEGFAYKRRGFKGVFREENVVGIVEVPTEFFGGSLYKVKKYAEKLEERIS